MAPRTKSLRFETDREAGGRNDECPGTSRRQLRRHGGKKRAEGAEQREVEMTKVEGGDAWRDRAMLVGEEERAILPATWLPLRRAALS